MIRKYDKSDHKMLSGWWESAGMTAPSPGMLPEDTTFIYEACGIPLASACLYLMNSKEAAMVEHVIGNPEYKGSYRQSAVKALIEHLEFIAKQYGYKILVLFSYQPKVMARYQDLGFVKTLDNVTTFAKQIGAQ